MKLIYLFLRRSPSNIVTDVTTKFLSNNFLLIFNNFIFFTYWPYGQETIGTLRAVQKWSSACLCFMQWFLLHSWHTNGISPCWWQVFREHLLLFFGFPTTRLLQPLRMCLSTCLLTSSWWDFFIIWLQIGQTGTWTSDKPTVEQLCSSGLRCSKQKISLQWEHWNGKKSSRLHDAKLQCFPMERRSASSAMMKIYSKRPYSSFSPGLLYPFLPFCRVTMFPTFFCPQSFQKNLGYSGHAYFRWLVIPSLPLSWFF